MAFRRLVAFVLAVTAVAPLNISIAQRLPAVQSSREVTLSQESRGRIRQAIAAVGSVSVRNRSDAGQEPRPRGSAVVVREDGVVVTNYHVITQEKATRLYDEIFFNLSAARDAGPATSTRYRLKAVLIDKEHDLALLRVESDGAGKGGILPKIELGDSRAVQLLDDLTVIGFPEKGGATVTISRGMVEGVDVLGNWIKTGARVIHGNSGGAAVTAEGKLIGIPTKVVADSRPIDKDGDGFPDQVREYGAVGFLRPAHLVAAMLAQLDKTKPDAAAQTQAPQVATPPSTVTLRGVVKSALNGKPIAGALVGLLPTGSAAVTASNLLTWGGSNADGVFVLKKPVPPGRYTLRAKAIGYEPSSLEVEVNQQTASLDIELRPAAKKSS